MAEIVIFSLIIFIFGVLPSIWYLRRKEKPNDGKPNIFMIVTSITLVLINTYLALLIGEGSIIYIIGQVYILPFIFVGIFSFFKSSRNWKSRIKIIFYTSLLILFSSFGNFISMVSDTN